MSTTSKFNVGPYVLLSTNLLCFCTRVFVYNKCGVIKMFDIRWQQFDSIDWMSFEVCV
jgi:hypothetical protein